MADSLQRGSEPLCKLQPAGLDDASEELARARMFRGGEDPLGRTLFEDSACFEEAYAVCDVAGEAHLVGRDKHGHPFTGQLPDDGEYLGDEFGVEGAGDLVKEHAGIFLSFSAVQL